MAARKSATADKKKGVEAEGKPKAKAPSSTAGALRSLLTESFGTITVPDPTAVTKVDVYSTGLLSLDLGLGIDGWARGRINYIAGPQHSGKTTLALQAIASIQNIKPDSVCAIIDIEHAYSESLAKVIGVNTDPERFIVLRPDTAENALQAALMLMGMESEDKGRTWQSVREPIDAIIYDSWAGSPTEEVGLAVLARVGSMWLPKIAQIVSRSNTAFFFINQIREKPGVMFGNPEYEPGGKAMEHATSIRVLVHKVGEVEKDSQGRRVGHTMKVEVMKNKLAPPFAKVFLNFNYYTGFDILSDALSLLKLCGVTCKEIPTGNYMVFEYTDDGKKCKIRELGEKAFLTTLRTDPDAAQAFVRYARQVAVGPNG